MPIALRDEDCGEDETCLKFAPVEEQRELLERQWAVAPGLV